MTYRTILEPAALSKLSFSSVPLKIVQVTQNFTLENASVRRRAKAKSMATRSDVSPACLKRLLNEYMIKRASGPKRTQAEIS